MAVRQAAGHDDFSRQVTHTGQQPWGMQIPWLDCSFYHRATDAVFGLVNQTVHPTSAPPLCQLCPWHAWGPGILYEAIPPHIPLWAWAWKYRIRQYEPHSSVVCTSSKNTVLGNTSLTTTVYVWKSLHRMQE